MAPAASKTYDETVVVALLMALKAKGGNYTETLNDMVALDGSRTKFSFEHSLRAANKIAGELNEKKKAGHALEPSDMGNGVTSSGTTSSATTKKHRRAAKGSDGAPTSKRARKSSSKSKTVTGDDDGV